MRASFDEHSITATLAASLVHHDFTVKELERETGFEPATLSLEG